jgi:hypothetical protein
MGGGDKRPDDQDSDEDEYEDREPDNIPLGDFQPGSDYHSSQSEGMGDFLDPESVTEDAPENQSILEQVKSFATRGNPNAPSDKTDTAPTQDSTTTEESSDNNWGSLSEDTTGKSGGSNGTSGSTSGSRTSKTDRDNESESSTLNTFSGDQVALRGLFGLGAIGSVAASGDGVDAETVNEVGEALYEHAQEELDNE